MIKVYVFRFDILVPCPYDFKSLNCFPPQIIKKPVDIAKIQQRIDDEKYEDMSGLQKVDTNISFLS